MYTHTRSYVNEIVYVLVLMTQVRYLETFFLPCPITQLNHFRDIITQCENLFCLKNEAVSVVGCLNPLLTFLGKNTSPSCVWFML